ncbi:PQQ-dependent sugar dehydrogenase [Pontibacter sp. KCTC 32443]|uniref:PQQ-dependent sugar dehydrogenase n=1 Tax=Pontibacter TaxID=323449 RepID=UPI00164DEEA2|nr:MULTISPECIES: PQQ-dependent sugar dehydrogenase [Pontibacter]MBC5772971.1 PQQ-dependent sugar dehydrogenase [Pontibacter sp. KCTC 32443]
MNELYKSGREPSFINKIRCANGKYESMFGKYKSLAVAGLLAIFTFCNNLSGYAQLSSVGLPSGFVEEQIGGEWNMAVGLKFSKDGKRLYVWEKSGKVWIVENGEKQPTPLIDISEEVGDWGDHGLLGFEIDPNFETNGYIYLLYVVDRHHLMNFGTGNYNASANDYRSATIGRVTRFTATGNTKNTVNLASRKVLLGETHQTGLPILYESHGVGSLVFGEDGSLLLAIGDGATSGGLDYGYIEGDTFEHRPKDTYAKQALADGIITQKQNIGAYRSQQIESLNGKILRIDPATGRGLPNNPFYESANPNSAASKVWTLGLRNPFRFSIKPGTGSASMPGVIYTSDTGWNTREEINIVTGPGQNLGWPLYEGLEPEINYMSRDMFNTSAPNPLYGKNGCAREFFTYQELLLQPKRTEQPYFGNFCDWNQKIPDNIRKFVHTRAAIEWGNGEGGVSRTPTFNGEDAAIALIGAANSPVTGPQFYGSSATGGVWYTGNDFPAEYKNTYFFGDYGAAWIKNASFDATNAPKSVRNFKNNDAIVVAFATNPVSGGLYYINYASKVVKVSYYGGDLPPTAIAKADKLSGTSPLTVSFNGSESSDPESKALRYEWDFGDGSAKVTSANPTHTFTSTTIKTYKVVLKVTDPAGNSSTSTLNIILNNTPPVVNITSPAEGTLYSLGVAQVTYNLRANVSDNEHAANQLTYEWQTTLHHNAHTHPEPIDTRPETTATITPIGCDGEDYFYRFTLKVTDAGGLSATDYVDVYPDCSGGILKPVSITSPVKNASYEIGKPISLSVQFANPNRPWSKVLYYAGDTQIAESGAAPFSAVWNGAVAGTYNITAKATEDGVHFQTSDAVNIAVGGAAQVDLPNCLPGITHYFGMDETSGANGYKDFASASIANCTDCPVPVEGKFHEGLKFSTTSAVDLNDASKFNWGKSTPFSISFWVRTTSNADRNSVIIGRHDPSSSLHWWIGMDPSGYAVFMLRDINHLGGPIGGKGPKLNDGNWHLVTAVRDAAANKNILYVDGQVADEIAMVYDYSFEGTAAVNIGYLQLGDGFHFEGDLDEMKLFDRALAATEISGEYNSGNGSYCGTNPLGIGKEENFSGKFNVYPNPTKGGRASVSVSSLKPNEKLTMLLSDVTGKKVIEKSIQANAQGVINETLSFSGVQPGFYNLTLFSSERSISRKILVVN